MARYFGKVGYVTPTKIRPGVVVEEPKEIEYYGDILSEDWRKQVTENLNDDLTLGHRISIMADAYAFDNAFAIRYAHVMGGLWSVRKVEVKAPRLILHMGGVYNGPKVEASDDSGDDSGE